MAGSGDLIDFNVIEGHKENIQALPSGRSAKALAQLYSPPLLGQTPSPALTNDIHSKARAEFEKELQSIDEADDPLDVYDRYVKWTLDSYPSAQATPQSQLLPLLERATKTFQTSAHYKNDPRYLKLWLHYIRLFSDAPRETFVYLARHGIGESMALYYEEFAAWLENAGRWGQAEEVYKMGMEKEATPAARLMRKFGEFEQRKEARPQDATEPSSPALPTVRPALAAKVDPFASASPSTAQQQSARSTAPKKAKSSKMQIFADGDAPESRPSSGGSARGWDSIGSLTDRKKENKHEAKPWAGEKLMTGKTNGGMQKMAIFKDESSRASRALPKHVSQSDLYSNHEQQYARNPKTGRMECVFVNLEAVYQAQGLKKIEYCFEELRAQHRGLLQRDWRQERRGKTSQKPISPPDDTLEVHRDSQTQAHEPRVNLSEPHGDARDFKPRKERAFQIFQEEPAESPRPTPESEHETHQSIIMSSQVADVGQVQEETQDDLRALSHGHPEAKPKPKQRGFQIFEDSMSNLSIQEENVRVETHVQTLALNDENSPPSQQEVDLAKQLKKEARQNRTRKIRVMDVQHINNETKTIQLNMDSPAKPKIKRKRSGAAAEPTMTINTKEAMDEIYGIFSQPLDSQAETDGGEDEDSDEEYTTDAESTGTGKLSGPPSDYGDDTRNEIFSSQKQQEEDEGQTDVTGWSDFTMSRHAPKEQLDDSTAHDSATGGSWEIDQSHERSNGEEAPEESVTPVDENPRTRFVPIPPEGYEAPTGQFRDPSILANNRLPFMTPIVEHTESSLGAATVRTERDYFNPSKTPSRKAGVVPALLEEDDEPCSSPLQEDSLGLAEEKRKILMPIRTKSTKGTISLGHGSAKSQIAAKTTVAQALEPQQKGPSIKDLQCNPMDPFVRQTILSQIRPPLPSYEGYHEHVETDSGRSAEVRKYISKTSKSKGSANGDRTASTLALPPMLSLPEAHGTYTIKRELGAGTFAPVYLCENTTAASAEEDDGRPASRGVGKSAHRRALEAIKMEDPPSTWEFYILRQSHRRLGVSRAAESIVRAHEMHLFRDECFLVEEYRDQGTLLDLVNIAKQDSGNSGGGVDEVMAMWFTVELLRTVEALHSKQLIHGDLKADNILIRFDDPGPEVDWNATYFPSGAHGWASKGVCLIDFGRGIDMKQHVPNVGFIADWKTTDADCAEMRELRPWTYQIDYHGLAGIVHTLLFGRYMETVADKGASLGQGATKTYRIRENLKRYWQTEIWAQLFALLLNPLMHSDAEEGERMPVARGMRAVRERMEEWLEENCERGLGLKGMIGRMEVVIREKRRKGGKVGA